MENEKETEVLLKAVIDAAARVVGYNRYNIKSECNCANCELSRALNQYNEQIKTI